MWYLQSYVTLEGEQKKFAKKTVKEFHEWHKQTQLPEYSKYIEYLLVRLDSPYTAKEVHEETDRAQLLIEKSFNQLIPSLADLCETFDQKQIDEIEKKLDKDLKKYDKKYVKSSEEKKLKLRINDLKDYLGPFFGRFTDEQKQWMEDWSRSLKPYEPLTLKQQEIWKHTFLSAMFHRDDREKLEKNLKELVVYQTDNWQPELQETLDYNQSQTYALLAKLLNNRTDKQKQKFKKKLTSYLNAFEDITSKQ